MMRRAKQAGLVGLAGIAAAAFTTFGGWAVVTMQDVPEYAVAGAPVDFVYDVRQHGVNLNSDITGTIDASSGEAVATGRAVSLGKGRFRARVTFPQPGDWAVMVNSGWGGGDMGQLKVIGATTPAPAPLSAANRGRQLFIAKGCVTCHTHQLTKSVASRKIAPDLSEPKFMSAYLTTFLADPSIKKDWKSDNRMPNLGLKPAEITALIAFLNRETKVGSR